MFLMIRMTPTTIKAGERYDVFREAGMLLTMNTNQTENDEEEEKEEKRLWNSLRQKEATDHLTRKRWMFDDDECDTDLLLCCFRLRRRLQNWVRESNFPAEGMITILSQTSNMSTADKERRNRSKLTFDVRFLLKSQKKTERLMNQNRLTVSSVNQVVIVSSWFSHSFMMIMSEGSFLFLFKYQERKGSHFQVTRISKEETRKNRRKNCAVSGKKREAKVVTTTWIEQDFWC